MSEEITIEQLAKAIDKVRDDGHQVQEIMVHPKTLNDMRKWDTFVNTMFGRNKGIVGSIYGIPIITSNQVLPNQAYVLPAGQPVIMQKEPAWGTTVMGGNGGAGGTGGFVNIHPHWQADTATITTVDEMSDFPDPNQPKCGICALMGKGKRCKAHQ